MQLVQQYSKDANGAGKPRAGRESWQACSSTESLALPPLRLHLGGQAWCFGWCHMAPGLQSDKHRDHVCHSNRKIALFLSSSHLSLLFSISLLLPLFKTGLQRRISLYRLEGKKKSSPFCKFLSFIYLTPWRQFYPECKEAKKEKCIDLCVGMEWKQISWAPMFVS